MRAFFFSILGSFLTPAGLVLMGVLDGSVVFFLPLGIDFVVIIMAARKPELFWLYALLATLGSTIGAAVTFWIGRQAGERGLTRFVSARRLKRINKSVDRGAFVVAALALIPPPFPFTAFVLPSGALRPARAAVSVHGFRPREGPPRDAPRVVVRRAGGRSRAALRNRRRAGAAVRKGLSKMEEDAGPRNKAPGFIPRAPLARTNAVN